MERIIKPEATIREIASILVKLQTGFVKSSNKSEILRVMNKLNLHLSLVVNYFSYNQNTFEDSFTGIFLLV